MSTATIIRPRPLYFAECSFGRAGRAFRETDRDANSRASIISLIRSGEIEALKVIEVIEPCEDFPRGAVNDVTEEVVSEAQANVEAA